VSYQDLDKNTRNSIISIIRQLTVIVQAPSELCFQMNLLLLACFIYLSASSSGM